MRREPGRKGRGIRAREEGRVENGELKEKGSEEVGEGRTEKESNGGEKGLKTGTGEEGGRGNMESV